MFRPKASSDESILYVLCFYPQIATTERGRGGRLRRAARRGLAGGEQARRGRPARHCGQFYGRVCPTPYWNKFVSLAEKSHNTKA